MQRPWPIVATPVMHVLSGWGLRSIGIGIACLSRGSPGLPSVMPFFMKAATVDQARSLALKLRFIHWTAKGQLRCN